MTWLSPETAYIAAMALSAPLLVWASWRVLLHCWQADQAGAGQIRMTPSRRREFLKEETMKKALVLALLFVPASSSADDWVVAVPPAQHASIGGEVTRAPRVVVRHDCRIARIDLKVTRRRVDGWYHLAATFIGYDGRGLDPQRCPDQNRPSWSVVPYPEGMRFSDALGYHFLVLVPPGPVTVDAVTVQGFQANSPVYPRGQRRFVAR